MNKIEKSEWVKSPITNKDHVIQELSETSGVSKMCIGSGYFTNEYPLNYKKHPDFPIEKYEENMPQIIKDVRFDDGESYWYPTTIQTDSGMIYPEGTKEKWYWSYTPIMKLSDEEAKKLSDGDTIYESKLDVSKTQRFDRFMEACKAMGGISFGDIDG